jgi:hypothetical protein
LALVTKFIIHFAILLLSASLLLCNLVSKVIDSILIISLILHGIMPSHLCKCSALCLNKSALNVSASFKPNCTKLTLSSCPSYSLQSNNCCTFRIEEEQSLLLVQVHFDDVNGWHSIRGQPFSQSSFLSFFIPLFLLSVYLSFFRPSLMFFTNLLFLDFDFIYAVLLSFNFIQTSYVYTYLI